ncbi:hypothetical protein DICVIV_06569 [Dictyocaulus viviparus]|uniref:Cytoplasmic dynein 2 light intermediate chain 1 n=1 Tax=Dictyocaulus viviparus TaxID=29172 RepID=A0A0D8XUD5_DICVI|nr:hypothetical protein DICVIV_06569 [Dictyocaulus viviparus]
MDIWSLVKKKLAENAERTTNMENNEEKKQDQNDTSRRRATHIIVCGNSQSGKSTLINKFLDKNEEHKETVALEYTYARRTRGNNKDICHIWELGGGTSVTQLLAIPFTEENIERASFVIALDLTRPNELWITMEKLVTEAQRYIKTVIKNLDQNKQAAIKNKRSYMNQKPAIIAL